MNEPKTSFATNVYTVALGGVLLFSTYQLGKWGAECAKEGVNLIIERKNRKQK